MKIRRFMLLLLIMGGVSAGAWADDSQRCYEMYPHDSYEDVERNALIQECLASYAPEPQYNDYSNTAGESEPAYYEGTVEDFVNEVPTE
jgi:hypothetical protein